MKFTTVGTGYVGLSNTVLFARNNEVYVVDISKRQIAHLS